MNIQKKPLIINVAIPLLVGGLSAWLTKDSMKTFEQLNQPPLSPPGVLFPIVWTILYILMGVSSARIYLTEKSEKRYEALKIYVLQLAINFLWSPVFFNLEAYLLALALIIILWVLILGMIKRFSDIVPWAGYLQIPYFLWVTFATYLNLMIYILN